MQVNKCFLTGPLRWLTEQKNPKFTKRTVRYNEFRNCLVRAIAAHWWQVITWRDLTVLSLEKFKITLHLNCFKNLETLLLTINRKRSRLVCYLQIRKHLTAYRTDLVDTLSLYWKSHNSIILKRSNRIAF